MRTIILLFATLVISVSLHGQDSLTFDEFAASQAESLPVTPHETVSPSGLDNTKKYSHEKIAVRKFDDNKWKRVVGNADYDNLKSKPKVKPKKTEDGAQQQREEQERLNRGRRRADQEESYNDEEYDEGSSSNTSIGLLGGLAAKIIFYTLVAAIIGFIIFYIIKHASFKSNPKVPLTKDGEISDQVEDINDLDIDALLQKNQSGDYRLLLRIHFLGLLQKLNEVGFIVWKKDKTNREYLTELFSREQYYEDVSKLTLAYEQVWYGDHILPTTSYQKLMDDFKNIDQKLKALKPL
jgi:Domain of unknown function (DUF4129)